MNFWQTFFGVSKGQVCTFTCTSIIDFRAFRMPGKTILQHNINQPGPLSDHPKRDTILPCTENGDCISFDWSMRQTQESGIDSLAAKYDAAPNAAVQDELAAMKAKLGLQ